MVNACNDSVFAGAMLARFPQKGVEKRMLQRDQRNTAPLFFFSEIFAQLALGGHAAAFKKEHSLMQCIVNEGTGKIRKMKQ